jgi:hypothetical protein
MRESGADFIVGLSSTSMSQNVKWLRLSSHQCTKCAVWLSTGLAAIDAQGWPPCLPVLPALQCFRAAPESAAQTHHP